MSKKLVWILFVLILVVVVLVTLVLYNILPEWLLVTIGIYYTIKNLLNDNKNKEDE
jgi:hypothetical protein